MSYLIKTYTSWRKLTAIILLSSFSISSILWAFPSERCNMVCEEQIMLAACCSEDMIVQSCCDMMIMNENDGFHFNGGELTLSDNNCELKLSNVNHDEYLLPKIIQANYELIELDTIHLEEIESTTEYIKNNSDYSLYNGPPIYIQISSYLI